MGKTDKETMADWVKTTLWFRPTPLRRPCIPKHSTMEEGREALVPQNLDDPDLLVFNIDSPPNCSDDEYRVLLQNASGQMAGIIMALTGSGCVIQGQFAQSLSPREITTINRRRRGEKRENEIL